MDFCGIWNTQISKEVSNPAETFFDRDFDLFENCLLACLRLSGRNSELEERETYFMKRDERFVAVFSII